MSRGGERPLERLHGADEAGQERRAAGAIGLGLACRCETLAQRPLPCFWQRFISVGAGLTSGSATRDNPIIQSHIANAAEFNTAGPVTQLNGITYEGDNALSGAEEVFLRGNAEQCGLSN